MSMNTNCHRCGKIIAKQGEPIPKDVFQIRLRYVKDWYSWDSKWSYLCPECFDDLQKWYADKNQELLKNLNAKVQERWIHDDNWFCAEGKK